MNYKTALLIFLIIISGIFTVAEGEPVKTAEFAVFASYTGNAVYDEIISISEASLIDTCSAAGRLVPFEFNDRKNAIEKSGGEDRDRLYRNAALRLKAGIYAVITSYDDRGDYILKIDLIPLDDKYMDIKRVMIVRSRIPQNIPLKAAREFAEILKGISLKCTVLGTLDDGSAVIDSGQWHGLEAGDYATDSGNMKIKNVSRYTAVVQGTGLKEGMTVDTGIFPDLGSYIKNLNTAIRENTVRVYGTDEFLARRNGVVKGAIQGTCVINEGASFCLPGYGSYLAVGYMGIDKGKPDYAGIAITASLTVFQLGFVPYMTGFDVNFFPWVNDSDRTDRVRRLNYFLWGGLPLTFAASFYSQLSYNYSEKSLLPPLFADHDLSASVVSVFVPGGGMFYKGYRFTGWGVYVAEMSMAGCAFYTDDKKERRLLIGSIVIVKCAEIAASYFLPPSYGNFLREISMTGDLDFSAGMNRSKETGNEFTASVSFRY